MFHENIEALRVRQYLPAKLQLRHLTKYPLSGSYFKIELSDPQTHLFKSIGSPKIIDDGFDTGFMGEVTESDYEMSNL